MTTKNDLTEPDDYFIATTTSPDLLIARLHELLHDSVLEVHMRDVVEEVGTPRIRDIIKLLQDGLDRYEAGHYAD